MATCSTPHVYHFITQPLRLKQEHKARMGAETCDEGVAGQLVGAKAEPEHSFWHSGMSVPHSIHRIPLPLAAVPDVNPCSLHLPNA